MMVKRRWTGIVRTSTSQAEDFADERYASRDRYGGRAYGDSYYDPRDVDPYYYGPRDRDADWRYRSR